MNGLPVFISIFLLLYVIIPEIRSNQVKCYNATVCVDGLIIPAWHPIKIPLFDAIIRAIIYLIALCYIFLGVSIISDKFMGAIEVITSKEKEVDLVIHSGKIIKIRVRLWNDTVSNLTLMALGSSAPEILLSVIEIFGKNFQGGALGPGTIVGSAAYNLFIIIGLCIMVIPNGEVRRIEKINVFFVTATFSVFAYLWVYVIVRINSIGIIDMWEALLTFLFFPLTVLLAYIADKNFLTKLRCLCFRRKKTSKMKLEKDEDVIDFENLRNFYMTTLLEMRKRHPDANVQVLEKLTLTEIFEKSKKSRAYYMMQATRKLTGGGNLLLQRTNRIRTVGIEESASGRTLDEKVQRIFFEPCHYTIMENVGTFQVIVKRAGGNIESFAFVDYVTEDGTALAGTDYIYQKGTLEFKPRETEKKIEITVIDDEIFEEEEYFTVLLSNLKIKNGKPKEGYSYEISKTNRATILILDDDHCGKFQFEDKVMHVSESCGVLLIPLRRSKGARGTVRVPYRTADKTAKQNVDYINKDKKVIFANEEILKTINIDIIDHGLYSKDNVFVVELGYPKLLEKGSGSYQSHQKKQIKFQTEVERLGLPELGEIHNVHVHIHENIIFKNVVDKLVMSKNASVVVTTSTWKEQFYDALNVNGGEDEENEKLYPSLISYIMHYLTLFWKVLFACVPPTDYLDGWLCFVVSILCIAVLTAIFGDLASSFGCTIGLLDEVTSMTFVAIGTSLPDTFASKYAAINDDTADNSIGNVTGSNAVNVFLGLGLAWTIATIVNKYRGLDFHVKMDSLGFAVTLFCLLAFVAFIIILARRQKIFGGGELGGPSLWKYISTFILIGLYFSYIIISSLKAYCHLNF